MIDEAMVEAIVRICNNEKFTKRVEPNIFCPMKIEDWMVRRIFRAVDLIQETYDIQRKAQGGRNG